MTFDTVWGEPLDNYDNVISFLKNANHKDGLFIGYRHITVSTCGLPEKILALSKEGMPITLCISLHSPFNDKRSSIMPINKKYDITQLKNSVYEYIKATGRRVSIEYALIEGENDTLICANELIKLFGGMLCHINLIPINDVAEYNYKKSTAQQIKKFTDYLNKNGLNATVRRELGSDINAACGQLRKQTIESGGDVF